MENGFSSDPLPFDKLTDLALAHCVAQGFRRQFSDEAVALVEVLVVQEIVKFGAGLEGVEDGFLSAFGMKRGEGV